MTLPSAEAADDAATDRDRLPTTPEKPRRGMI